MRGCLGRDGSVVGFRGGVADGDLDHLVHHAHPLGGRQAVAVHDGGELAGLAVSRRGQHAKGEVAGQVAELPGSAIGQELLGLADQARLAGLVYGEAAALAAVLGHVQHRQQPGATVPPLGRLCRTCSSLVPGRPDVSQLCT